MASFPFIFIPVLWAGLVCLFACIEPFVPETGNPERLLVVEGHISDVEGTSYVYLSRSQPLNTRESDPETSACVSIIDEEGYSFSFEEINPGTYMDNPANFIGAVGKHYTLDIVTADGNHYQSAQVPLKRTPPIDSIYFEVEERFTTTPGEVLSGIAVLLDTHDSENSTWYYRWEFSETWEERVSFPPDGSVYRCFDFNTPTRIILSSTTNLQVDSVNRFELNYVSTVDHQLTHLYSIRVKQYALSAAEYEYWSELQSLTEGQGTLFDAQSYGLRGNVYNVDNDAETVLGYFGASSTSNKRVFIHRDQLRGTGLEYPSDAMCANLAYFEEPLPLECTDCRWHGGTMEIPDYWPN